MCHVGIVPHDDKWSDPKITVITTIQAIWPYKDRICWIMPTVPDLRDAFPSKSCQCTANFVHVPEQTCHKDIRVNPPVAEGLRQNTRVFLSIAILLADVSIKIRSIVDTILVSPCH